MYRMRNKLGNVIYEAKSEKERDYYLKNGFEEETPTVVTSDDGGADVGNDERTPPYVGDEGMTDPYAEANDEDESGEGENLTPENEDAPVDDEAIGDEEPPSENEEKPAQNKSATKGRRSAANK